MKLEYLDISRLYYAIRHLVGFMGFSLVCAMTPSGASADLQDLPKVCAGIEVQSLNLSEEIEREVLLEPAPERPTIKIVPAPSSSTALGAARQMVRAIAIGPVLDLVDSHKVETDLACTATGVRLTATITRFEEYYEINKSIRWRPKIELEVVPLQPAVKFETTWRIRLTTGVELDHAQTPPYPDQKYPITVSKTLSSYTP